MKQTKLTSEISCLRDSCLAQLVERKSDDQEAMGSNPWLMFSVTLDLSDNLTEMRQIILSWKTRLMRICLACADRKWPTQKLQGYPIKSCKIFREENITLFLSLEKTKSCYCFLAILEHRREKCQTIWSRLWVRLNSWILIKNIWQVPGTVISFRAFDPQGNKQCQIPLEKKFVHFKRRVAPYF